MVANDFEDKLFLITKGYLQDARPHQKSDDIPRAGKYPEHMPLPTYVAYLPGSIYFLGPIMEHSPLLTSKQTINSYKCCYMLYCCCEMLLVLSTRLNIIVLIDTFHWIYLLTKNSLYKQHFNENRSNVTNCKVKSKLKPKMN